MGRSYHMNHMTPLFFVLSLQSLYLSVHYNLNKVTIMEKIHQMKLLLPRNSQALSFCIRSFGLLIIDQDTSIYNLISTSMNHGP